MASKFSSLLVKQGLLQVKTLEDAFARQVIQGGELDTVLLERDLVPEARLVALMSRVTGFPPLSPGVLRGLDPEVAGQIPVETAQRTGVCPIRRETDRGLSVLVLEGTDTVALEELAYELDLSLQPVVAPEVRLNQAQYLVYGIELPRRFRDLLARLGDRPPEPDAASLAPTADREVLTIEPRSPMDRDDPTPPDPTPAFGQQATAAEIVTTEDGAFAELPPLGPAPVLPPATTDEEIPDEIVAEPPGASEGPAPPSPAPAPSDASPAPLEREPRLADEEPPPIPEDADEDDEGRPRRKTMEGPGVAPAPPPEQPRTSRAAVEPLSQSEAIDAMQRALDRDELLEGLARGVASFVPELMLFIRRGEKLRGYLTLRHGELESQEARQLELDPAPASVVSRCVEGGGIYIGPVPDTDSSRAVLEAVGAAEASGVVLVPLSLRGKTVALALGHTGAAQLPRQMRAALDLLAREGALALAELIVRQKQQTQRTRVPVPHDTPAPPPAAAGDAFGHAEASVPPREATEAPGRPEASVPPHEAAEATLELPERLPAPDVEGPAEEKTDPEPLPAAAHTATALDDGPTLVSAPDLPLALGVDEPPPENPGASPTAEHAAQEGAGPTVSAEERTVIYDIHFTGGGQGGRPSLTPKDMESLLQELEQGGARAAQARQSLEALGKPAIRALVARFPGLLRFNRLSPHSTLPPVAECSLVLRALATLGRPVLSSIAPLLRHPEQEVRFYATYLISELVYPEAVSLLAKQLQDPDVDVRRIAVRVLRQFRELEQFPIVVEELRNDLRNPDPRPRRGAAEALGALGDEAAVPLLVELLDDTEQGVRRASHAALVTLTKQDFDQDREAWLQWWESNQQRSRVEWLIDGLVHAAPDIRAAAATELEDLTGTTLPYSYDMPRRAREEARRQILEWWHHQQN